MFALTGLVVGEAQVSYGLSRFSENVEDWRPLWDAFMPLWANMEEEQFNTQGARSGTTWEPLKATYATYKAKVAPGAPILYLTGTMRADIIKPKAIKAKTSLQLWTTAQGYWKYHQAGTPHMARRPVVQFTESDLEDLRRITHRFLYDSAKKAGLPAHEGA